MSDRPQTITFAEMRDMGVRGVLIYCADYKCSHSIAVNADQWPDDLRLSDIEDRFTCSACGKRGADVRPDFQLGQRRSERLTPCNSTAGWFAVRRCLIMGENRCPTSSSPNK
jgi:hypothetical protein